MIFVNQFSKYICTILLYISIIERMESISRFCFEFSNLVCWSNSPNKFTKALVLFWNFITDDYSPYQQCFKLQTNLLHSCDECGRSYKTKKSLSRHRKFECRFAIPRPLFKCPSCNYAAKRSDNLTKHYKKHYSDPGFLYSLKSVIWKKTNTAEYSFI